MAAVRFTLNGELRAEESVPPTMTVLDWLRTRARLTGTKEGCAEGDCGACTIAVARSYDGTGRCEAVNSCLMMLPQLDGCDVLTVEGLSKPGGPLHPIQQAMVDADATQCGFCTPGFVMAMFALQQTGEPAGDDIIHDALAGNLCRCTGYRSIVDACRQAMASKGAEADRATPHESPGVRLPPRAPRPVSGGSLRYAHGRQVFHAPTSLAELLELRAHYPDAVLLAGGTDLGLRVSKEREALPLVISTIGVCELNYVRETAEALEIGAASTYSDALPQIDRRFPSFGALIRRLGSRQIRNLGTFAGNLATASPIGDTLPCLIALDANVTLRSRAGEREMPVEAFITGYRKTALAPDEVITGIRIPFLASNDTFAAYKLSKRFDQDISTVVAAFRLRRDGGKVLELCAAFGGMAARPARAQALEAALTGSPWSEGSPDDIDTLLAGDFSPLSDHRGGGAYRLRAAAGLVRRFALEITAANTLTRVEAL